MHSLAVSGATGGSAVSAFAGQQQHPQHHTRRITNAVAGCRRRRFRSSLASAQPLPAQTYTSDILKAAAVQVPSGAVVPRLAEEENEVPNVVALKLVSSSSASANAAAVGSATAAADAEQQPPHAPLRSPTSPLINWLPRTRWPRGIPVVMGAHLLASGGVAPISVSKGLFFFSLHRSSSKAGPPPAAAAHWKKKLSHFLLSPPTTETTTTPQAPGSTSSRTSSSTRYLPRTKRQRPLLLLPPRT